MIGKGSALGLALDDGDNEADGLLDCELLGLSDADGLSDGESEADGLRDSDGLDDADGLRDAEGLSAIVLISYQ